MNEKFHSAVEVYTLLGCYATGWPKKRTNYQPTLRNIPEERSPQYYWTLVKLSNYLVVWLHMQPHHQI